MVISIETFGAAVVNISLGCAQCPNDEKDLITLALPAKRKMSDYNGPVFVSRTPLG